MLSGVPVIGDAYGMAADSPLSDHEREAIARAILDDGLDATAAARAAAAGQLTTTAFEVAPSTCRQVAREAEAEPGRAPLAAPEPELEAEDLEALSEADEKRWLEKQVAAIKARQQPTAKDLTTMRSALEALAAIRRRELKRARQLERQREHDRAKQEGPKRSRSFWRLDPDERAELDAVRQAVAAAPGRNCQCGNEANPSLGYYACGVLVDGHPTCETCRLPIDGWAERWPGLAESVELRRQINAGETCTCEQPGLANERSDRCAACWLGLDPPEPEDDWEPLEVHSRAETRAD
jgi:hypothetical protein